MYQANVQITIPPTCEPIALEEVRSFLQLGTETAFDEDLRRLIRSARSMCEQFTCLSPVMQTVVRTIDCLPKSNVIYLPWSPVMKFESFEYKDSSGAYVVWDPSNYQADTRAMPARITRAYAQSWPVIRGGEDLESYRLTYIAGFECPVTADASTDILTTKSAHPFTADQRVRVSNSGEDPPAPLTTFTDYFVRDVTPTSFKLAATQGGSAIDLSDVGTRQTFVYPAARGPIPETLRVGMMQLIAHWFVNRESVVTGTIATPIPMTAQRCWWPHRLVSFGY